MPYVTLIFPALKILVGFIETQDFTGYKVSFAFYSLEGNIDKDIIHIAETKFEALTVYPLHDEEE